MTFNKNIFLKLMVDKNHNQSESVEKLLCWNEFMKYCKQKNKFKNEEKFKTFYILFKKNISRDLTSHLESK